MSVSTEFDLDAGVNILGDIFYPVFDYLFDEDGDLVGTVETKLKEARMNDTPEYFISKGLGIGILSGLVLWLIGMGIGYGLFAVNLLTAESISLGIPVPNQAIATLLESLVVPTAVLISGLVFGIIGFGLGFGSYLTIPFQRANQRKRNINILLPDAISFMYALSVGGMNQLEIFKAMAETQDTYDEVANEFKSIVNETEYFGTDYRNAIRDQALETPSEPLSQFLTDMLSIIDSGGDIESFLQDKKDRHMRTAKQAEEETLETLELFGEMYMTLSLFPLLLLIIMVVMGIMGEASNTILYLTIYGLIPIIGVGFLILVATVKKDDPGDGYLEIDEDVKTNDSAVIDLSTVNEFVDSSVIFESIKSRQRSYELWTILRKPHLFFKTNPVYTLAVTVPLAVLVVGVALATGNAPLTRTEWIQRSVWSTLIWIYLPAYITLTPLAIFYEWNVRSRKAITGRLSENLRKIASANDTGQTLQESIKTVAETSSGTFASELNVIHNKVAYGISIKQSLIEFNNKYHVPRLARTVKLITEAQEATNEISDVLTTAAQASENTDDVEQERTSRTRMQVGIILMTFVTLLGVMAILQTQFISTMTELAQNSGGGESGISSVNGELLSMLFFHAVTIQAFSAGIVAGFIRSGKLLTGIKFVVILMTLSLGVWSVVG